MTTKVRKRKTTREHEVEDNYRPRLHRSVGVYLALKDWTHGIDCIVLSRKQLLQFFDMKVTTGDRMGRIKMDLKPWFKGFMPSCPQLVLLVSGLEPPKVSGLEPPKVKEAVANPNRSSLNFAQIESPPASGGTNVPNS